MAVRFSSLRVCRFVCFFQPPFTLYITRKTDFFSIANYDGNFKKHYIGEKIVVGFSTINAQVLFTNRRHHKIGRSTKPQPVQFITNLVSVPIPQFAYISSFLSWFVCLSDEPLNNLIHVDGLQRGAWNHHPRVVHDVVQIQF